jgi:exosome complex component MTR3
VKSKVYSNEAELNVDVRFASFATRRRKRAGKVSVDFGNRWKHCIDDRCINQDTESASVGDVVRSALLPSLRLDLLPKASIDVFITVLQVGTSRGKVEGDDDEACAAAATTVASCALADAGIEMWALVVGMNGVLLQQQKQGQGQIVVDASHTEVKGRSRGAMSLWTMPALGTVTAIEQWGDMSPQEIGELMEALQKAAGSAHYTIAKALKDSYIAREAKGTSLIKG